ncbi:Protein FAR1-RELATED SEQUENCE 5 [Ananas comosus]|uniref:Protein FAR1-RELATED SEQUENCE 5 n=1 Tax=Ananas comosus TaxID=4615 RepID=A0A199USZ8_ANACO|nr:Protein FAR1-RELATED SEQUENCE 5 [Ananas comosus]
MIEKMVITVVANEHNHELIQGREEDIIFTSLYKKTYHYKAKKHDDAITSVFLNPKLMRKVIAKIQKVAIRLKSNFLIDEVVCKAHIVLRIDDREKWVITVVANEHNHELIVSPSKSRFFRSHRAITKEQKELIHMLNEQNISTSQIMAFMQAREGGRHNIHFTRKDLMTVVRSENIVSCTCKLFEFYGLLCAHVLKVMHYIEIYNIPPHYILNRWTKNAKKRTPSNSAEMSGGSSFCRSRRFDSLTLEMQKFIFEGSKSLKAHETACQIIREGIDTLTSINQMFESEEATIKEPSSGLHRIVISQSSQVNMLASECTIKDPPQSQCKGKRKPQRFKPPIEKKVRVPRTCKQCGKKGHNIRTCKEV